jgi:hypothetical protein
LCTLPKHALMAHQPPTASKSLILITGVRND